MTPEAQRIAIAETCGWKWHGDPTWQRLGDSFYWKNDNLIYCQLPDYLNDLNAMHQAEKTLRGNQFHAVNFPHELFKMVSGLNWKGDMGYFIPNFTSATAAQRAEAFLRTVGKWDDTL
jgi:hypothetical protein